MPKASELKKGQVVEIADEPYMVKQVDCKSPSSRGASTLYKIRFVHAKTKQKRDESFKGEDFLRDADCQRVQVQYSYRDGEEFCFMTVSYTHLRAHETLRYLVCRLLLEKKKR